jgi:hypothetical protein
MTASWADVAELIKGGDPIAFAKGCWPKNKFYDKQEEVIYSVKNNEETVVVAGNMLGKDYVAGFIALWFFVAHHPVRVITTSVRDDHLRVLWGEIGRFCNSSRLPLLKHRGGCIQWGHRDFRKVFNGSLCDISYMRGMVSERGEGMAGHHAANTLAIIDEASGVANQTYTQVCTWAKKILIFGNPHTPREGPEHFFYKAVKQGDIPVG